MNLVRLLFRSSQGVVILSILAGIVAGLSGITLIALIQGELTRDSAAPWHVIWEFLALCVLAALARVVGQAGMVRLGQGAAADLGLHIVRRTLELPLRKFESIDSAALL